MSYSDEKDFEGQKHRGMKVGGVHHWTYPEGRWTERKVAPQGWEVAFTSLKRRRSKAPASSGAEVGSGYHWFIVAHQWAGKLDANTYATHLEGTKHLISFRKPGWQGWTTQQRGHTSARLRTVMVLEEILNELRERSDGEFEDPMDEAALSRLLPESGSAVEPAGLLPPKAASRKKETGTAAPVSGRRATSRPSRVRRPARSRRVVAATPAPRSRRR